MDAPGSSGSKSRAKRLNKIRSHATKWLACSHQLDYDDDLDTSASAAPSERPRKHAADKEKRPTVCGQAHAQATPTSRLCTIEEDGGKATLAATRVELATAAVESQFAFYSTAMLQHQVIDKQYASLPRTKLKEGNRLMRLPAFFGRLRKDSSTRSVSSAPSTPSFRILRKVKPEKTGLSGAPSTLSDAVFTDQKSSLADSLASETPYTSESTSTATNFSAQDSGMCINTASVSDNSSLDAHERELEYYPTPLATATLTTLDHRTETIATFVLDASEPVVHLQQPQKLEQEHVTQTAFSDDNLDSCLVWNHVTHKASAVFHPASQLATSSMLLLTQQTSVLVQRCLYTVVSFNVCADGEDANDESAEDIEIALPNDCLVVRFVFDENHFFRSKNETASPSTSCANHNNDTNRIPATLSTQKIKLSPKVATAASKEGNDFQIEQSIKIKNKSKLVGFTKKAEHRSGERPIEIKETVRKIRAQKTHFGRKPIETGTHRPLLKTSECHERLVEETCNPIELLIAETAQDSTSSVLPQLPHWQTVSVITMRQSTLDQVQLCSFGVCSSATLTSSQWRADFCCALLTEMPLDERTEYFSSDVQLSSAVVKTGLVQFPVYRRVSRSARPQFQSFGVESTLNYETANLLDDTCVELSEIVVIPYIHGNIQVENVIPQRPWWERHKRERLKVSIGSNLLCSSASFIRQEEESVCMLSGTAVQLCHIAASTVLDQSHDVLVHSSLSQRLVHATCEQHVEKQLVVTIGSQVRDSVNDLHVLVARQEADAFHKCCNQVCHCLCRHSQMQIPCSCVDTKRPSRTSPSSRMNQSDVSTQSNGFAVQQSVQFCKSNQRVRFAVTPEVQSPVSHYPVRADASKHKQSIETRPIKHEPLSDLETIEMLRKTRQMIDRLNRKTSTKKAKD